MNQLVLELIRKFDGKFKVCFSLSGTVLDQMEAYAPEVLHSFQELVATGHVELLNETYGHSLCALKSETEFKDMVNLHQEKIQHHFNGYKPKVFRNTELIYSDEIGAMVAKMGFDGILSEGAKHILGWKSPNFVYVNSIEPKLKVLLKNFRLSDDIAFRFGEKTWTDYPLTTDKFIGWLNQVPKEDEVINLFMDYETFGEHQWKETGIFEFMKDLPGAIFQQTDFSFSTPSEVIGNASPVGQINVPTPISWADEERDLTAWLGKASKSVKSTDRNWCFCPCELSISRTNSCIRPSLRAIRVTLAPLAASCLAMAAPMPLLLPPTRAFFPFSEMFIGILLLQD